MNQHFKLCLNRYLFILTLITLSSIILSPDLKFDSVEHFWVSISAIFFYRFNIFSVFSLLFATLTTIQTFERENLNVALSIAGIHSFKLMRPVLFFSMALAALCLTINEYFLSGALTQLRKDAYLSSYNKNLQVHKFENSCLFFQKNFQNFTYIDDEQNIIYAKKGEKKEDGFLLHNVDKFEKKDHQYFLASSDNEKFLPFDHSLIKKPSQVKMSASLSTLIKTLREKDPKIEVNTDRLKTTLAYRIFLPLLNIFAVSIATIFGFSSMFRRRTYLSLGVVLFISLLAFYLLECSAILGNGGVVSPLLFIAVAGSLSTFTPLISYLKKV